MRRRSRSFFKPKATPLANSSDAPPSIGTWVGSGAGAPGVGPPVLGCCATAGAAASRPTINAPVREVRKEYFFMRNFERRKLRS